MSLDTALMSLVYGMLVSLPPLHHTLQQVGDGQTVREEKWIRIKYLGLNGYRYIHSIFVPLSQSNDIAKKSAFKPKRGHESTTGIHLIDE